MMYHADLDNMIGVRNRSLFNGTKLNDFRRVTQLQGKQKHEDTHVIVNLLILSFNCGAHFVQAHALNLKQKSRP